MNDTQLARHGTILFHLSARTIRGCAARDLENRHANKMAGGPPYASYAFHREDVRAASDAADLIARAITNRARGMTSGKRETVLLYADGAALEAAQKESA